MDRVLDSMTRVRTTLAAAIAVLILGFALPARAETDRGWTYLIDALIADGVKSARVHRVFADPRVPPFDELEFSVSPHEPRALYRGFLRPQNVAAARRCRLDHASAFESAGRVHGVSPGLIAAVIYVESGCGRNTGKSLILPRLARLAMANEPENVRRNVAWRSADPETAKRVRARAQYLWDTFYPEVRAVFEVAERMNVDPLDIRGSESGAFGFPQFLPASYLKHGEDGNHDGHVSLYDMDDAAASCASYLAGAGWKPGLSVREQRMVIWQYNRSEPYIETILALADRVERPTGPVQIVHAKAHKKAAKAVRAAASRPHGTKSRHARSSRAAGSVTCRAGRPPSRGCSSAARSPAAPPAS